MKAVAVSGEDKVVQDIRKRARALAALAAMVGMDCVVVFTYAAESDRRTFVIESELDDSQTDHLLSSFQAQLRRRTDQRREQAERSSGLR